MVYHGGTTDVQWHFHFEFSVRPYHNMIAYTSCRSLLRPCNTYILITERKVFNYLRLYFCVDSLHLKKNIFIDLTVHIRCFVKIYIIIWANTQLNLIIVFRYLWYAKYNCKRHEKVSWKWHRGPKIRGKMHYETTCLFLFFTAIPTSKTSLHIATECTIKQPRFKKFLISSNFQKHRINSVSMNQLAALFQKFLRSPNFQNIVSNSVTIHLLASLFSKCSQ
mgnify:CR=1 FL=1